MRSNVNTNGGFAMKTLTTAILATMFLINGCASDTETSITGTPNVNVSGTVDGDNHYADWDPNQCFSDEDCLYTEICVKSEEASKELGFAVSRCESGCSAEFTTVMNEDGTSVTLKAGDSCERFGDKTYFCDMDAKDGPVCVKYTKPAETPVEPEPVEPEPTLPLFVKVSCCFNAANVTDTMFAQLAWSTSDAANPKAFAKDGDLEINAQGCFVSTGKIERSKLYLGFWTELTDGTAATGTWMGSGTNDEYSPISCEIDDVAVSTGTHTQSCGFGLGDAVLEDGTSANCLE